MYTIEELRKYNYNKTHPEYEHADIPSLEEVLALVKPGKMIINIELKTGIFFYPGIEEKVVALVKQYGMEDRVIYSSFNHYSAKHIHDIDPGARTAFLYEDGPIDMPEYAHRHGVNAIHPALYNLQYENIMEDAAKYGLEVNVWTVNTEEYVRFCMMKGVHGIITNYPDMARKIADAGHEIAMHSVSHPHMPQLNKAEMQKELDGNAQKIREVTNVNSTLFRFPFGDYDNVSMQLMRENGIDAIQWSIDTLDTKRTKATSPVYNRVCGSFYIV